MMAEYTVPYSSFDVFGAKITPATRDELLQLIKHHVDRRRQCIIAYQNMHGMNVRLCDDRFDRLHRLANTYVHIDGMPLVLLCRLLGISASRAHRVTLVDLIWPLLQLAASERRRVYYLGGTDDVLSAGTAAILRRIPNLVLRSHNGFFELNGPESTAVLRDIREFRPDIVLVGMGMGRQEHWILSNFEAVSPACVYAVGACMEYLAGAVKTPPRWLGPVGLEWLFRLCEKPGRFWHRYLVEPWFVLCHILRHASTPPILSSSAEPATSSVTESHAARCGEDARELMPLGAQLCPAPERRLSRHTTPSHVLELREPIAVATDIAADTGVLNLNS